MVEKKEDINHSEKELIENNHTNTPSPIEKLKILKDLKGYSFQEISDGCDCSKAQIVLIFQGKYWPSAEIKVKLAEYFKVNVVELWDEEKNHITKKNIMFEGDS